jgi:hypothetical protein
VQPLPARGGRVDLSPPTDPRRRVLATVIAAGLVVAVLARRVAWVRQRLPVPGSTILSWVAAGLVGLARAVPPCRTGRSASRTGTP